MPELPEVETTCRGIKKYAENAIVEHVNIHQAKLRYPVSNKLPLLLKNQVIKSVERRGKYIILQFDSGNVLIHLGMSGSVIFTEKNEPLKRHDHVEFYLDNTYVMRYNDPRRFGCVLWTAGDPLQHALLKKLGVEPLLRAFTGQYLYRHAQSRSKVTIKQFIMDSHVVVGVGNIYANEALFLAMIKPQRLASSLTLDQCSLLVKSIKKILRGAIKLGGTTIRNYLNLDSKPGYFIQKLNVYNKANCKLCKKTLKKIMITGRSSFYCDRCQK